eukprot:6178776-Pyramimonas_sp.AAC.1
MDVHLELRAGLGVGLFHEAHRDVLLQVRGETTRGNLAHLFQSGKNPSTSKRASVSSLLKGLGEGVRRGGLDKGFGEG